MSATTQGGYGSTAVAETEIKPLSAWLLFLIGVASALVGLLPWFVAGLRLPLQNLWENDTTAERMPLVLLPFSQYTLTLIVALLLIGSAVAGLIARATRARQSRGGYVAIVAGVLLTQLIATVQTAVAVGGGLQSRSESTLYLSLLIAVAALAIAVGVGVLVLIARAPRAGALVGLSIASVAAGSWLSGLIAPVGSFPAEWAIQVLGYARWIPAILVGIAIAWCGVNTVGRVIAAIVGLVLLWLGPALITAISSAAGSRVLAGYPSEMLDYGVGVFRMAFLMPELVVPPLVVAIVVAAVGLGTRMLLAGTRGRAATATTATNAAESPATEQSN
ncbi:hypothetical protein [Leifsonia sp. Leaf264]|uniref:hypothetical protein n=1 Tax=Leifsonia sp. Leaf264 TaxID=1736314 RepID=UPI0007001F1B|nr:hypothetical protein [Leifsonia sp. Leaf264]KQO94492.1 hypothetical protein ASF30_21175 [Leifsonia sp. Leaf264]